MSKDWRFKHSPSVMRSGLRAYGGVPLKFETEFGEQIAFGSLCIASSSAQTELTKSQKMSLNRIADWIVADIMHSARARRQQERRRMLELLSIAQKQCDGDVDMTKAIPEILRETYPGSTVGIHRTSDGQIVLNGGTVFKPAEAENGLWEDIDHFDYVIKEHNHHGMVASRAVRTISSLCASQRIPTYLIVASNDFRMVFDDADAWFIHMCATILCRYWQGRALKQALAAKETFLRGITHQLRTPIHGILGSVELLTEELRSINVLPLTARSSPETSPGAEQIDPYIYIRTIRTSARDLISTVNSLIKLNQWADIAQAERHVSLHTIQEIEAALMCETSFALQDDLHIRPSIIFHHNFPQTFNVLAFDIQLFLDAIQPLVTNAIQNTAGGVVAITFSITDDYNSFIVDVEDNGRGIPTGDSHRIFTAYEKIDHHTIDAGLGLTLSSKSAALMNGNVSLISSRVGEGSHFRAVFSEPVCASSFPPLPSIKDKLVNLPRKFCRLAPRSEAVSPLGYHFITFLTSNAYSESKELTDSFLVLENTSNLAQFYNNITQVPCDQVAICLVPEAASFIEFDGNNVQRQNQIVYVQGPFLSSTIEKALHMADSIHAELQASSSNLRKSSNNNTTPELPLKFKLSLDIPTATSSRRRSLAPQRAATGLADSPQQLHVPRKLSDPAPAPPQASTKPMTLLVDDNEVNLRLLQMYCSRRAFPYTSAADGLQAVAHYNAPPSPCATNALTNGTLLSNPLPAFTQPFDLILMDLQMPHCDGIEATRRIRAVEQERGWKRSVVFIVTGQDSAGDRRDAEEAGADAYLVKPAGPKVLDRWVKMWFPDVQI